jgi:hypothetical protein
MNWYSFLVFRTLKAQRTTRSAPSRLFARRSGQSAAAATRQSRGPAAQPLEIERMRAWHARCSAPELEMLSEARRIRKGGGMNTSRAKVIGIGLGLYLLGFGMLAGATVERMRFDHRRSQMLARYDRAIREWHAFRIELEKAVARTH